jgi:hypothetical protein
MFYVVISMDILSSTTIICLFYLYKIRTKLFAAVAAKDRGKFININAHQ